MRWMTTGFALFLLVGLTGCPASQAEAEAHAQKILDVFRDLTDTLASIKDAASSKAANAKLTEIQGRLQYLIDNDVKVTKRTQETVTKKITPALEEQIRKLEAQLERVGDIRGAEAEMEIVKAMFRSMEEHTAKKR